jgi:hypothetical protein
MKSPSKILIFHAKGDLFVPDEEASDLRNLQESVWSHSSIPARWARQHRLYCSKVVGADREVLRFRSGISRLWRAIIYELQKGGVALTQLLKRLISVGRKNRWFLTRTQALCNCLEATHD